jgi:hypothetical protein
MIFSRQRAACGRNPVRMNVSRPYFEAALDRGETPVEERG